MIDLPLLRLRYEILNVPLIDLAEEVDLPLSILEKEVASKNWKQWWPEGSEISIALQHQQQQKQDSAASLTGTSSPTHVADVSPSSDLHSPSSPTDDDDFVPVDAPKINTRTLDTDAEAQAQKRQDQMDGEIFDDDTISPLEEQSQLYLKNTRLRLQVFNLAKEVLLAHKYAKLEVNLIEKASELVDQMITPAHINSLSTLFKNLTTITGTQMSISQNEDGIPTVIVRDLSGKR